MAGQGARFGHRFKPFLTVGDETFIEAALRPFRQFANEIRSFVFVYLAEQEREHGVKARLDRMFEGLPIAVVLLDEPTRGPAETIERAVTATGATGPALICDCDHSLDVAPLFAARAVRHDALIPIWPLSGESVAAWSVAMVDDDNNVLAVAEKRLPDQKEKGQPFGVIGCYGFADIAHCVRDAKVLSATNFSDVIANMLVRGATVRAARIEHASFFGDPTRLAAAVNQI